MSRLFVAIFSRRKNFQISNKLSGITFSMQFVENSLSTAKHTQEPFLLYALVIQMLPKSTNTKNDLS